MLKRVEFQPTWEEIGVWVVSHGLKNKNKTNKQKEKKGVFEGIEIQNSLGFDWFAFIDRKKREKVGKRVQDDWMEERVITVLNTQFIIFYFTQKKRGKYLTSGNKRKAHFLFLLSA